MDYEIGKTGSFSLYNKDTGKVVLKGECNDFNLETKEMAEETEIIANLNDLKKVSFSLDCGYFNKEIMNELIKTKGEPYIKKIIYYQKRKNHQKRINKKWLKKYGITACVYVAYK